MEIELRDYQMDIYNKIRKAFSEGANGVAAVLPCRSRQIVYNG